MAMAMATAMATATAMAMDRRMFHVYNKLGCFAKYHYIGVRS
jgi:hypothetical protein